MAKSRKESVEVTKMMPVIVKETMYHLELSLDEIKMLCILTGTACWGENNPNIKECLHSLFSAITSAGVSYRGYTHGNPSYYKDSTPVMEHCARFNNNCEKDFSALKWEIS